MGARRRQLDGLAVQQVVVERLLPVVAREGQIGYETKMEDFLFEPDKTALLERLAPMYVDISILRALYESQASFLGAQP